MCSIKAARNRFGDIDLLLPELSSVLLASIAQLGEHSTEDFQSSQSKGPPFDPGWKHIFLFFLAFDLVRIPGRLLRGLARCRRFQGQWC